MDTFRASRRSSGRRVLAAVLAAAVLITIIIFLHRRVGLLIAFILIAGYVVYLYGLWANWSLDGLGDLIVQPAAQTPD